MGWEEIIGFISSIPVHLYRAHPSPALRLYPPLPPPLSQRLQNKGHLPAQRPPPSAGKSPGLSLQFSVRHFFGIAVPNSFTAHAFVSLCCFSFSPFPGLWGACVLQLEEEFFQALEALPREGSKLEFGEFPLWLSG